MAVLLLASLVLVRASVTLSSIQDLPMTSEYATHLCDLYSEFPKWRMVRTSQGVQIVEVCSIGMAKLKNPTTNTNAVPN